MHVCQGQSGSNGAKIDPASVALQVATSPAAGCGPTELLFAAARLVLNKRNLQPLGRAFVRAQAGYGTSRVVLAERQFNAVSF